mmetsp:Transcript_23334/g.54001  ORF Transcript_23334/g.54001 Transcript_23334/m.54001 type:complete len:207 (-) Transcript_23334:2452-3072(-)
MWSITTSHVRHHETLSRSAQVRNCSSCFCVVGRSAPAPPSALTPRRSSLLLRESSRKCAEAEPVSSTSREKCESGSASSASGSSNSTSSPASKSMIAVESMIVCSRCAIVSTVHSANISRIAFCSTASVSLSMEAVASSSASTSEWRSVARARQSNCRCPTEKFCPPSVTLCASPSWKPSTSEESCTTLSTRKTSSSECPSKGSKL